MEWLKQNAFQVIAACFMLASYLLVTFGLDRLFDILTVHHYVSGYDQLAMS